MLKSIIALAASIISLVRTAQKPELPKTEYGKLTSDEALRKLRADRRRLRRKSKGLS